MDVFSFCSEMLVCFVFLILIVILSLCGLIFCSLMCVILVICLIVWIIFFLMR